MKEPAFPLVAKDKTGMMINMGMSLRDYFAAKAMQGFASYIGPSMTFESRAKIAYEWADAMLKAREA
jgi:hypothetical protein